MDEIFRNNLIVTTRQSSSAIILTDEKLKVLACSIPFYRAVVTFNDDIHALFDANALQRIKRCRKNRKSMKIKTKTSPFALLISINWLSVSDDTAYMLGFVESNCLFDANQSLAMAYSNADQAVKQAGQMLYTLYQIANRGHILDFEPTQLIDDARKIQRHHERLTQALKMITDSQTYQLKNNNISRIVRLTVRQVQQSIAHRNIRISLSMPELPCLAPCDLRYFTKAITECLTCLTYFTQDNHRLSVELVNHETQHEIIFHDPVFQIPEPYAEALLAEDVRLPNTDKSVGLYFSNTIIRKHNGLLTVDRSAKIGYSIRITIPASHPGCLLFEDSDDSNITNRILDYIDEELINI